MYFYISHLIETIKSKMNISNLIAKRWATSTPLKHTRRILRMGIWSMGLCIAVMVVAICILVGFKQEISNKVFGFGSHVIIQPYWSGEDGSSRLVWDSSFQNLVFSNPYVLKAQPYAQKGALIRGNDESHGVFFKGLPDNYDTSFFAEKLEKGRIPCFQNNTSEKPSSQVLISESLAKILEVDTGSRLRAYFMHEGRLRPRILQVCGIYATGLENFDETYILGDIRQIRQINGWADDEAEGIDIQLEDPRKRFDVAYSLGSRLPYEYSCFPCDLLYPEIFDWLALIDTNVLVLMLIMLIVCLICLISILFILIIERKPHVWILRTMGASDGLIRRIFVKQTLLVLGKGMLWGNAVALSLCLIQKCSGLIRLDVQVYYLDRVPIAFPWGTILLTNAAVFISACILLQAVSGILKRKDRQKKREKQHQRGEYTSKVPSS